MGRFHSLSGSVVGALLLLVGSGCSMSASNQDPSIYLDLSALQRQAQQNLVGGNPVGLVPTTATSFSCYAINVTGPGIGDSSHNPSPDVGMIFNGLLAGKYCSYKGVTSPTFHLDGSGGAIMPIQVPPGSTRLIQVVGITNATTCARGFIGDDDNEGGIPQYFEVARGIVNNVFGDASAEVYLSWPSTGSAVADGLARLDRSLDCGGNNCSHPINSPLNPIANYGTSLTASAGNKLSQLFTVNSGTYLRRLEVAVTAPMGTVVYATLYKTATGTTLLTATDVLIQTTSALMTSAVQDLLVFDFFDPVYRYPYLPGGENYYIVFSTGGTSATFLASSGATGNVSTATGGNFSASAGVKEIYMRIHACK